MIGGEAGARLVDLAALTMLRGGGGALTTFGTAHADLAWVDAVTARAQHLWFEQWRTLLREQTEQLGAILGLLQPA